MTRVNSPSVIMVAGIVRMTKMGLMKVFTRDNTNPAIILVKKPSTATPGISSAVIKKARPLIKSVMIVPIYPYGKSMIFKSQYVGKEKKGFMIKRIEHILSEVIKFKIRP